MLEFNRWLKKNANQTTPNITLLNNFELTPKEAAEITDRWILEIKDYGSFKKIELVNKGWSNDKKYYIEAVDGRRLLLRVADISEYERKKTELKMMEQVAALGVPMSQPLDLGVCDNGKSVYLMLTWCDGEDAEIVLPRLTKAEQYVLGIISGEILKLIHSIPAPKEQEEWSRRFNRKTSNKIEKYKACGIKFDGDDKIINYIENNRHLLSGRPQCYRHGDYHVNCKDNIMNIMICFLL